MIKCSDKLCGSQWSWCSRLLGWLGVLQLELEIVCYLHVDLLLTISILSFSGNTGGSGGLAGLEKWAVVFFLCFSEKLSMFGRIEVVMALRKGDGARSRCVNNCFFCRIPHKKFDHDLLQHLAINF
jgi:hypothetical protein